MPDRSDPVENGSHGSRTASGGPDVLTPTSCVVCLRRYRPCRRNVVVKPPDTGIERP